MKKLEQRHLNDLERRPAITPEQRRRLHENPAWTSIWNTIIERTLDCMQGDPSPDDRTEAVQQ